MNEDVKKLIEDIDEYGLELTAEEARRVVYEDHGDFKVIKDEIVDTGRWDEYHDTICEHIPTGKFFLFEWNQGLTESQPNRAFEDYTTYFPIEVEPKEVTVIKYIPKK